MKNNRITLRKLRYTLSSITPLLFLSSLSVAPVYSKELNAECLLKIDGKTYMDDRCQFRSDADSDYFSDLRLSLVCPNGLDTSKTSCTGAAQKVKQPGMFGYLFRKEGVATLCWNMGKLRKASPCFEGLRRSEACWSNPSARNRYDASQVNSVKFCAWAED